MDAQNSKDQIFDQVIDRHNTYSVKYDLAGHGKPDDTLPLWVADMDFAAPQCVIDALAGQCRHGVFGYSDIDEDYYEVLKSWFLRHFAWEIKKDCLINTPRVVTAIKLAIRSLTEPGDSVIIQEPVYYPFSSAIRKAGRSLVVNKLVYKDTLYSIDFDEFESLIEKNNVKMFILCSPHNPVGRVWTQSELLRLGNICLRHGVIIIADEIHQDFTFNNNNHCVFETLSPAFPDMTITCTSPSKTFNLAGIHHANIFISNPDYRERFLSEMEIAGHGGPNIMGIVASRAAYIGGEQWLRDLLAYLHGNFSFIKEFLDEHIPRVKLVEPEGTYLAWLDFQELELGDEALRDLINNKCKLWLDDGPIFGAGGNGFQRLNVACPRTVLQEAMSRLERAILAL